MKLMFAVVAALLPIAMAEAQAPSLSTSTSGTRVDIVASGEVTRVPDIAVISAGVVTRADTATAAIEQNAARMERVRAALRKAGIAERDIQTSSISLNPDYAYVERQPPRLTGYQASNMVNVRFRDLRSTGKVLDALVAEGANQINGPTLTIDQPEPALDEARARAIAIGRKRADLYAKALGMNVIRVVSVSESGGYSAPPPMPAMMVSQARDSASKIDPGEQRLQVSVTMSFELR